MIRFFLTKFLFVLSFSSFLYSEKIPEIHEFVIKNWRIVKVATTKAQRKLFFKLKSKKTTSNWLTESEKKNIANELDVKPETITQMESRLSGSDISYDPMEEDELSPSSYLTDNMDPSKKLECEDENCPWTESCIWEVGGFAACV